MFNRSYVSGRSIVAVPFRPSPAALCRGTRAAGGDKAAAGAGRVYRGQQPVRCNAAAVSLVSSVKLEAGSWPGPPWTALAGFRAPPLRCTAPLRRGMCTWCSCCASRGRNLRPRTGANTRRCTPPIPRGTVGRRQQQNQPLEKALHWAFGKHICWQGSPFAWPVSFQGCFSRPSLTAARVRSDDYRRL